MATLDSYIDEQLARGRTWFTKPEALSALQTTSARFLAAAERQFKKGRIVRPRRGFYLIVRPEDQLAGAPDPARWIDPLMRYLGADYRISLLRAAAFHGSAHQAAMVFQVVAPVQAAPIVIGRQRIEFIYQAAGAFGGTNRADWLTRLKTDAGYAKMAGAELTMLDSVRYFHKAAGINGVAQIVHDIGAKALPRKLAQAAALYENTAVRRLGYLLEHFGHGKAAKELRRFAKTAKSFKPLDPSVRHIAALQDAPPPVSPEWKLILGEKLEIDT